MSKETMGLLGSVAVPAVTSLLKGDGPKPETNGETAEGKTAAENPSPLAGGLAGIMDNVLPGRVGKIKSSGPAKKSRVQVPTGFRGWARDGRDPGIRTTVKHTALFSGPSFF